MSEYKWLQSLLEDTKDAESPVRFKLWAALFCVGAVTRRSIYYRLGNIMKLYPNLYVMIIAESGFGKQFPINMATFMLKEAACTRMIGGQNSIEEALDMLSHVTTIEESKLIIKNAEGAFISGEFANLFLSNPDALTIVTQLYDTESLDEWQKSLRKGTIKLKNVFLSFLTATNMDHYNDKIQEKDIQGGYIARTMCIYEDRIETLNSLMDDALPDIDWKKHAQRLIEISKLHGVMTMTPTAKAAYDKWYYPFHKNRPLDKTMHVNRVRAHIIKVAMCLSLIEGDDLIIQEQHIEDAKDLCLRVLEDVIRIGKKTGKSKYKSQFALIIMTLIRAKNHMMLRSRLMDAHRGEWTWRDFDETIQTLIQMGNVEIVQIEDDIAYRLTRKAIDDL